MRLRIRAVGRLRDGPEARLVKDYLARTARTGARLGLGPATVEEVEDRSGGGREAEAALLLRGIPPGAALCVLDERGRLLDSPAFAARLADWRDAGTRDAVFVIGGADGVAAPLREGAGLLLSLGPMVWPHMLVRVMLAEQLYRATSILSGGPYHRV